MLSAITAIIAILKQSHIMKKTKKFQHNSTNKHNNERKDTYNMTSNDNKHKFHHENIAMAMTVKMPVVPMILIVMRRTRRRMMTMRIMMTQEEE